MLQLAAYTKFKFKVIGKVLIIKLTGSQLTELYCKQWQSRITLQIKDAVQYPDDFASFLFVLIYAYYFSMQFICTHLVHIFNIPDEYSSVLSLIIVPFLCNCSFWNKCITVTVLHQSGFNPDHDITNYSINVLIRFHSTGFMPVLPEKTIVGDSVEPSCPTSHGVPQGYILCPLLYYMCYGRHT